MKSFFEAYKGDEPYAFVSYSHADSEMVYPMIKELNDEGYRIWYDEGIAPSVEWRGVINEHIRDCAVFTVFVTRNSMTSHEVIKECTYAINLHKKLHIIYLENVSDEVISSNLIADFTNNQRVHAYEMHSEVFAKRLREPLADCVGEVTVRNTEQEKKATVISEDGESILVKAWKMARPSYKAAMARMITLIVMTLALAGAMLIPSNVQGAYSSSTGMMVTIMNVVSILCLIPLIKWVRKTKHGSNAVINRYKLEIGFGSETVFTVIARFMMISLVVLTTTSFQGVYSDLDSWTFDIWLLCTVIECLTLYTAVISSTISRCILMPILKGKKKPKITPLTWHMIYQGAELGNILVMVIVLVSCMIMCATPASSEVWGEAHLTARMAVFAIAVQTIMLFHERSVFKLGKVLVKVEE